MMFDKFCINKILSEEKTVTRRLIKSNRRPAIPGKIHKLKIDRTDKTYGYIKIKKCEQDSLLFINNNEARLEGFNNSKEYLKYFAKVNKSDIRNLFFSLVWRIEFELIE